MSRARYRSSCWRRFSWWLLLLAERFYLHAHGWDRVGPKSYTLPDDYPFRRKYLTYEHSHAVNAQKQVGHV